MTFLFAALGFVLGPLLSAPEPEFIIEDSRPSREVKKNGLVASLIFDCDFGVYNISDAGVGDERAAADRVRGLQTVLLGKFGDRLRGHTMRVTKYRLLLNGAAAAKRDSVDAALGKGVLAPMIANGQTTHAKCSKEKMSAGWIDVSEIKNAYSPIVVEFEATFDGLAIRARSVASPSRELSSGVAIVRLRRADTDEFQAAYDATNLKVVEAIQEALP